MESLCPCYCLQGWINDETEIGVAVASIATAQDKGRGSVVLFNFEGLGTEQKASADSRTMS